VIPRRKAKASTVGWSGTWNETNFVVEPMENVFVCVTG